MGEDLAGVARDVDVPDALDLNELVDERLQRGEVPVQEDVDARIGDVLCDVRAVALVLLRQLAGDCSDGERGCREHDRPEQHEDAEARLAEEFPDPDVVRLGLRHANLASQSLRVTKRPSSTTV
ncbi:hypothetical protein [Candidatus Palauibacter sp.]|uniref:hypothetical protein n=1 Tax=Candidatus Palauibacter sp. TaxID=3101350 RepID=UPI003B51CB97